MTSGGRCDFDDGGSYTGSWQDGMSHGHGICTGPLGQGEYAGSWQYGFEVSGVYTWTSGNYYEGQWLQGKRHGIGVERKGHWLYRGEWTQGFKGRYGIRQSTATGLKFEGTWTSGLQDGYGVETYADGGTYQGQWLRGLRHGYGVRQSVSYDLASRYQAASLPPSGLPPLPGNEREEETALLERDRRTEESRGGFVLLARTTPSEDAARKKQRLLLLDKHGRPSIRKTIANELRLIRQKSTGDIQEQQQLQQQPPRSSSRQSGGSVRSTVSGMSQSSAASGRTTASSAYSEDPAGAADAGSFVSQTDLETGENVVEKYLGEWKNDKRSGFGICERSDGLKYEGEWFNNKKYGYGVTTLRDGSRLEGKYKNNVLVSSSRSSKLFLIRSSKVRDRVDGAVLSAHKAAEFALQKAEIANARMTSARMKCEQAEEAAKTSAADAEMARAKAREYSPNSNRQTPGEKIIANRLQEEDLSAEFADYDPTLSDHQTGSPVGAQQPQPPPPKKFSFFKFKKDASLRGRNETFPRPTAAEPFSPTQTLRPQGPGLHPAAVRSPLPSFQITSHHQPTTQRANDFRPAQQLGAPVDIRQPQLATPFSPRGQVPGSVENRWTAGQHEAVSFHQQGGPVPQSPPPPMTMMMMNAVSPDAVNVHANPLDRPSSPGIGHLGPGFEDSYNWMGYGGERRKSLPSIVKDKDPSAARTPATPATASPPPLAATRPHVDTYVIEDGVRKKVRPLFPDLPVVQKSQSLLERERHGAQLPRKLYELEAPSLYRRGDKGSMPDVTAIRDVDVMPREAVYVMSQHRREELMRERAEEERRRRNQIVFRLGDLKDWCQRRQVLVFVLALNIGLAAVFYNMLQ